MATDESAGTLDVVRQRVRARLAALRISAREASRRAGFNVGYVGDFLEGRSKSPETDRIVRLADALEMPLSALIGGEEEKAAIAPLKVELSAPGHIPLFAAKPPTTRAFVDFRADPIEQIETPPVLRDVKGGYAVEVFNSCSEPRYFPGETVYVSPTAAVRPGDFVFVRLATGSGIARFVGEEGDGVRFEILNPVDEDVSTLAQNKDVRSYHRIVGSAG